MTCDSIVNVSEAQAKLSELIDRDSFAISRNGKIVGVYLSRERFEALVETVELLSDAEFTGALKEHEGGKMRFQSVEELDELMSR